MKRAWNYLLTEPFSWLFNYLLYPFDVNNQVEKNRASERVVPMLRLALPMFTFSFLSALIILVPLFLCSLVNDLSFLLFIGLAVALSTVGGIIGGIADGIKLGLWSGI